MSFEWTTVKLSEISKIVGGGTPSTSENSYWDGNIPWITPKDLSSHKDMYISSGSRSITEIGLKNSSAKLVPQDTVLFTSRAPIGYVAIASQPVCTNQGFKSLVLNEGYDSRFFYYLLKHHTPDIEARATGSTFKEISGTSLGSFEVSIPSTNVQKQIADLLSTLDNRITLLRETNTTLEAIAQALFKSWFVDFDPVLAKSEGKLPEGMDEATAALFPDAFEETDVGMVPKGWQASTLSSLATFQNGYAFKGGDWVEQGHPVIKIGNVKPLLIDFEGCSYVSPETVSVLDRFKLNRGDLLVGMTGYVGETGLVTSTEVASYLNQRVGRIVTSQGLDDLGFVFATVRQAEFKAYAESQSHGSAQANVSGADLMKFTVVVPSAQVLNTFNQLVGKLIEKILANFEQAKTLTNLRDTLLPRLISGQLRIADAEAELERVTA